jgi:adenosylhomocysteine nucleosidase
MPGEPGSAESIADGSGASGGRIAVIAALGIEAACLPSAPRGDASFPALRQSGPGIDRARAAAQSAVADGALALVCWGFAGGLGPGIDVGAVVLPRHVVTAGLERLPTDSGWRRRLVEAVGGGFVVEEGDLLETRDVLDTPRLKARAALGSDAVAVDMESAAVAGVAALAGIPFVAVKVVLDTLTDTLPPGVARWIDERGERRLAPLVDVAYKPAHWRALLRLAQRHRAARRRLRELGALLLPQGFLCPYLPAPRS